ncbi:hypothetical protein [Nocardia pseudovaccinii]|uniref:hypothetical protein n=1 Tax=Nocardia pseudovaccinii TaxID=189540 RepID=UPI0007A385B8|nr:hypothetical protein [Nocardia pseudovaccinii]
MAAELSEENSSRASAIRLPENLPGTLTITLGNQNRLGHNNIGETLDRTRHQRYGTEGFAAEFHRTLSHIC